MLFTVTLTRELVPQERDLDNICDASDALVYNRICGIKTGILGLAQTFQQYFEHPFAAGGIILPDYGHNPNNCHLHPRGRDAMVIELARQPPLGDLFQERNQAGD